MLEPGPEGIARRAEWSPDARERETVRDRVRWCLGGSSPALVVWNCGLPDQIVNDPMDAPGHSPAAGWASFVRRGLRGERCYM